MGERWAVNGHWVVKRWGLFGGRLVVLDPTGTNVGGVGLQGTDWTLDVAGREYRVDRLHQWRFRSRDEWLELRSPSGVLIPPGGKLLQPTEVAPESRCHAHPQASAVRACVRCGSFVCEACLGANAVHCAACFQADVQRHFRARMSPSLFWATPVPGFFYFFGPFGGIAGGLAALAVTLAAPRCENVGMLVRMACVAYGVALAACAFGAPLLHHR